jgi:hypothetical protein
MMITKIDGTNKQYVFEDGRRCAFGDNTRKAFLMAGGIETPFKMKPEVNPQVPAPEVIIQDKKKIKRKGYDSLQN